MRRIICAWLIVACLGALLVGCTGVPDKRPDEYSGIRWISPDYSIRFTPDDGCKGSYYFNDKKYNLRFEFDSTSVNAYDTDNNDACLFYASWTYEENERLYLYNISFDKEKYKEMKNNYMEFITLKQESLEKK